jgi:hypothetical protein
MTTVMYVYMYKGTWTLQDEQHGNDSKDQLGISHTYYL